MNINIYHFFSFAIYFFLASSNATADLAEMQSKYAGKIVQGRTLTKADISKMYSVFDKMGNPFMEVINEIKSPGMAYKVIGGCDPYYQRPYNYICRQSEGNILISINDGMILSYRLVVNLEETLGAMDGVGGPLSATFYKEIALDLFKDNLGSLSSRALKISFSDSTVYISEEL